MLPVVLAVAALLLLNTALGLRNWWPTPAVLPNARLSPEFVGLWLLLLLAVAWRGRLSRPTLAGLTAITLLLVLGRYADVTVPSLFGRPVNLYWDGQQIPRFLWVSARAAPVWVSTAVIAAVGAGLVALWSLLRWALGVAVRDAAPYALRHRWTWPLTAAAAALVVLHGGGWAPAFTWHWVTDATTPTYWRQARLLAIALDPTRLAVALPRSPTLETALAAAARQPPAQVLPALRGRDFKLLFLESYGAMVFDDPRVAPKLAPARARLAAEMAAAGWQVASAYVRSPTFAGASDLAHLTLLSGIDLSDPLRHDLLLTTRRPTLTTLFRSAGYQSFGFYPGLSWDWAEGAFYGFDRLVDGRDLAYAGPPLGYWKIPDQFAMARFDQLHPVSADTPPRFLFFATSSTHLPFGPVPPLQPDWQRLLGPDPFGAAATERLQLTKVDWLDMLPNYIGMFDYTYAWLGSYLQRPEPRESVMLWLGDHQPAASVSGNGASWDVPVHIVTRDAALLQRFVALGFRAGLTPQRPALGGMDTLTALLVQALGEGSLPAAVSPAAESIQRP